MDTQVNNSYNNEEEEDLQDKIRIQAELQDLFAEKLTNYDDGESSVNSTNISAASISIIDEKYTEKYKDTVTPGEQFDVLYAVRTRELAALQHKYEQIQEEKNKQVNALKNQLILHEGEIRQLQISINSLDELLVEKTGRINELNAALEQRDETISNLKKNLQDCENELKAYRNEVTELHLKLQTEYGPFNLNSKYNSKDLQKTLQEKISHLENALEEETKSVRFYEKNNNSLKEELNLLMQQHQELNKNNNTVINNFDKAQQQCKDLIDVIETAKRENDYLKGLLEQKEIYVNSDLNKAETMDPEVLLSHNEELRKMLVVKSMEIDTLRTKLRFLENYENELLTYRQLQNDVYKKEFLSCNNASHTKDLLLMQNALQNYKITIDDKDKEILKLNSLNKDLQEKIENTILQTRSEIQNISHKYSMPQLEEMTQELKKAEATIKKLNEKLEKAEHGRQSLVLKLKSNENTSLIGQLEKYEYELKEAKKQIEIGKEDNLKVIMELKVCKDEVEKLKKHLKTNNASPKSISQSGNCLTEQHGLLELQLMQADQISFLDLIEEIQAQMKEFLNEIQDDAVQKINLESKLIKWKKLLDQIKDAKPVKKQFTEAESNLEKTKFNNNGCDEVLKELENKITILKGEKYSILYQLSKCQEDLEKSQKINNEMQIKNTHLQKYIQEKEEKSKEHDLKLDAERQELTSLLKQMNTELGKLKTENLKLQNDLKEANDRITKNLEKKLNNAENDLERKADETSTKSEFFQKHLHEELIKAELKLRDELQLEYQKRINEIENRYQESCRDMKAELKLRDELHLQYEKRIKEIENRYQESCRNATALCKQQTEQLHQQEDKYKKYLKMVMLECAEQVKMLETKKVEAMQNLNVLKQKCSQTYKRIEQIAESNESKVAKIEKNAMKKIKRGLK